MRGALLKTDFAGLHRGIIPADAGSTNRILVAPAHPRDHPRGCGEHLLCDGGIKHASGSSPRMRGARVIAFNLLKKPGIIPADAGSTQYVESQAG